MKPELPLRHGVRANCALCTADWTRFKIGTVGVCAALLAWASAAQSAQLDDCEVRGHATVLQAAAMLDPPAPQLPVLGAQAHWLTPGQIAWPQAQRSAAFKLYHSARGQILTKSGAVVSGADGALSLQPVVGALSAEMAARFKHVPQGWQLALQAADLPRVPALLTQQLVLVQEDAQGRVMNATRLQVPGVLDGLYAAAHAVSDLGAHVSAKASADVSADVSVPMKGASPAAIARSTQFKLWAPTAQAVAVCRFAGAESRAERVEPMVFDPLTGVWSARVPLDASGSYYRYLVDVWVAGVGVVRNAVSDPYAVSANTDSVRSYVADLNAPSLMPSGWRTHEVPARVKAQTDMLVYELHVRDFSITDTSVSPPHRGKYLAFTESKSRGMTHLRALAAAGMTDIHLLPVFDIATIPESGCTVPRVPAAGPDSEAQQAAVMAGAASDCFNWGYDPFHFNAPEGSYASTAADGAARIREFRAMVMALHKAGLRVGMDVVYNHTAASGQSAKSVLDRIVPGYYHRLSADGVVERSTCCDNTATEHLMMGKLMVDSAEHWVRHFKIDTFRFDLMAHQPRTVMEQLQQRVNRTAGRHVNLIGEGWNFGEVQSGARFVQASQLSLNESGIGTFSDRARDAVRGGGAGDSGEAQVKNQGYINGLFYSPNALAAAEKTSPKSKADLLRTADMVRVGLAGSLRNYVMVTHDDQVRPLRDVHYGDQPAGYVTQPGEVVNYVENHDNETLFDINALKLPLSTTQEDRARVQMLGVAINMFSQGVAYFHAGIDTLRSKSMDRNSYDSGDWFNRIDWNYQTNHFGTGAPPKGDNGQHYALTRPLLATVGTPASIAPRPVDIALARDMFRDLLKIRASTRLFRLRTAQEVQSRLKFHNTGSQQNPTLLVAQVDGSPQSGKALPGARFAQLLYFVNVSPLPAHITLSELKGQRFVLHPVHRAAAAADKRPARLAKFDSATGHFAVPARTALVYVLP